MTNIMRKLHLSKSNTAHSLPLEPQAQKNFLVYAHTYFYCRQKPTVRFRHKLAACRVLFEPAITYFMPSAFAVLRSGNGKEKINA